MLAIGSGSTIAVFSVVDRLILRDPPYRDPSRVVTIWQTSADTPSEREGASPGAFVAWRERATSFEAIAAVEPFSFDYLAGTEPETLLGGLVTERFFEALGVAPLLGRTFRTEEHVAGRNDIVMLSYGGWQRLFGGDRNESDPMWSADQRLLAYVTDRGGQDEIWVSNADGRSAHRT